MVFLGVLILNNLGFETNIAFNPFYKHMFNITLKTVVTNYGFILILKPKLSIIALVQT